MPENKPGAVSTFERVETVPGLRAPFPIDTRHAGTDPMDLPFSRRDMISLLEAQLAYPGFPQRVIDAMKGRWS